MSKAAKPPRSEGKPNEGGAYGLWVLAAVVIGALVRLAGLDSEGLWLDEVMPVTRALDHGLVDLWSAVPADKPPLFFYEVWPLARLTLDDPWLRLPAFVFGAALVWGIALLAGALFPDRPFVAPVSALLCAFSPLAAKLSCELLTYSQAAALVTGGYIAGLAWLQTGRRGWLAALFAAAALALWTSYQSGLALVPLGAVALVAAADRSLRSRSLALAAAVLAAALTTIPLWPRLLGSGELESAWGPGPFFTETLPLALGVTGAGFDYTPANPTWLALWVLAAVGGVAHARSAGDILRRAVLPAWLLGGLGLLFVSADLRDHWIAPRYLLFFAPPLLLMAAAGIERLCQRLAGRRGAATAGALCAALTGLLVLALLPTLAASRRSHPDYRGLARDLSGRAQPGDLVLFQHRFDQAAYEYYRNFRFRDAPLSGALQWRGPDRLGPAVARRLGDAKRVWVAETVYASFPIRPEIARFFRPDPAARTGPIPVRLEEAQAVRAAVLPGG